MPRVKKTSAWCSSFHPMLAPYKIAVLPLSEEEVLTESPKPRSSSTTSRQYWSVDYDETQSIGRRYRRPDEIGTPFCLTIDFNSLEDKSAHHPRARRHGPGAGQPRRHHPLVRRAASSAADPRDRPGVWHPIVTARLGRRRTTLPIRTPANGEQRQLTLTFAKPLRFDLSDAKLASAKAVAAVEAGGSGDTSEVQFKFSQQADVRTFREDSNYVVDVSPVDAKARRRCCGRPARRASPRRKPCRRQAAARRRMRRADDDRRAAPRRHAQGRRR